MTSLFEIGPSDVADTTDDYYTPRWIFDAAGLMFDLDVAAPVDPGRRFCPALRYFTPVEDGLSQTWHGLVWMNPPYSNSGAWVERFSSHPSGLALLPTLPRSWLGTLMRSADAVTLLEVTFARPNGERGDIRWASLLVARGLAATAALARVAAADRYMCGAYHVRLG